jgi:hypothetical protein
MELLIKQVKIMEPRNTSEPSVPSQSNEAPTPANKPDNTLKIILIVVGAVGGLFVLLIIGFVILVFFAASGKDNSTSSPGSSADTTQVDSKAPVTASGSTVTAPCYSYTIPQGYELENKSAACASAVNIPSGDSLTLIQVLAVTNTDNIDQGIESLKKTFAKEKLEFVKSEKIKMSTSGMDAAKVYFKDPYGNLLRAYYYIPDPDPSYIINGKLIGGYTIDGYAYNSELESNLDSVVQSFILAE